MPDRLSVMGRVVAVTPIDDAQRCRIIVGPPPDLVSFEAALNAETPRLGQRVRVGGRVVRRTTDGLGSLSLTHIEDVSFSAEEEAYAQRVTQPIWLERSARAMARPLYRYQIDGAGWLAQRVSAGLGSLLCDDPGLGKTTQSIAAMVASRSYPALIICPASLKLQWAREFEHTTDPPVVNIVSGKHGSLPRAHVHVANYDLLRAREQLFAKLPWKLVVLDEVQYVKEPKPGKDHRAAVVTRLCAGRQVIGLTGTPIMNRGHDLWRLLHLVDRERWPSFEAFVRQYCTPFERKDDNPTTFGRAVTTTVGTICRLDELQTRAAPYMLRRLKHEVLVDLPKKSRRTLLVQLDAQSMVHYRAAERDTIAWLRSLGYGARAQRASHAEAIVRLGLLRRLVALAKLRKIVPEYLARWFDRDQREPLVIFGYHKHVVHGLRNICQQLGLRVSGIGGGESSRKRQQEVDRFQRGDADVFVASLLAAGVGLNLQRASEALFVERVFSPSALQQAEDRVHRIGSDRPVTITYLDAADTVDEQITRVLEAKARLIQAVLSEETEAIETSTVVDEIAEMLAR